MGEMVIVAYRPKAGRESELLDLVRDHVPFLRRLGLATDRPASAMRSNNGVIVEVFEWEDGAITSAHENPEVQALWKRFAAVCDYIPLYELPEAKDIFAQFEPIDL
ncbi:MAG: hypothetical protein P8172_09385 [Gammaproteobacteria bacterium]|jgi:hypothetical protein